MAKFERILAFLPSPYAARDASSLLYDVVRALATPLEEADTLLFRIQRAHRLRVAEHVDDIQYLAAVLNLDPVHFEDIARRDELPYELRLESMRKRVQRIAQIHLQGLGSPMAVMEGAAVFLDAGVIASAPQAPLVHHIDERGYSHWSAIEFAHAPQGTRSRVYLHENPLLRRKAEPADRYPFDQWTEENRTVEPTSARVVIVGVGDRTVLPEVYCPLTGESIRFYGVVPDGARLVIDEDEGARLDGRPVDDWVSYDVGARIDSDAWDGSTFLVERDGPRTPFFDGDMTRLLTPPYRRAKAVPRVPLGRSDWGFSVEIGKWDRSVLDFAVFDTPTLPRGTWDADPGFDSVVFDFAPSGIAGLGWDERIPCPFKLLLPPRIPVPAPPPAEPSAEPAAPDEASTPNEAEAARPAEPQWEATDIGRIGTMLQRFRPAGVRAFVDVAKDAWIIGESVIRDAASTAEPGIEHRTTRVRDERADLFIPLDPTATQVAS